MAKYLLTQEGYDNLIKEDTELKQERRIAAVDRLKRARDMGDLSENSEYHAAKEDLSYIEGRIQEIEQILKDVEVVEHEEKSDKVTIGSEVKVKVGDEAATYMIVGEMESDFAQNKLSYLSPIGKALMNSKKGQKIKVNTPNGSVEYIILDVK
jgi:transcription elongation factor GreA